MGDADDGDGVLLIVEQGTDDELARSEGSLKYVPSTRAMTFASEAGLTY